VDALWFLGWVLRWVAARQAWHHYAAGRAAQAATASERGHRSSRLSYVMVGGALALMLSRVIAGDDAYLATLTVATMVMGALLVLRQFAEVEENRRLFRAQIQRESRFRSLVQKSSDVVLIVGPDGLITYVSPSVDRVFGEGAPIAVGKPFRKLLPPEDAGAAVTLFDGDPQAAPQVETRIEVAPGSWRDVEIAWTDLRGDPSVGGIVVSCRDTTERHGYERALRHAQELDAVGHLAGGLAHDLNNLLTIIRGYAQLLRSESSEGSSLAADLDQVVAAVDRAASVTARILAFSRNQPVRRKPLDLNTVIDNAQPLLGNVTREPVEIRLDLDRSLWRVRADQGQMEQVLVNLVSNAGDAMPRGGDIQIATANRAIAPETGDLPPGDYVALTVSDRGVGMSPEVCATAFEPFFSTKPAGRGLGLGLAVVRGIVSDMDGQVTAESREGIGSTFTVLLPRAEAE
jgi:PAS domain S-box-containing protein